MNDQSSSRLGQEELVYSYVPTSARICGNLRPPLFTALPGGAPCARRSDPRPSQLASAESALSAPAVRRPKRSPLAQRHRRVEARRAQGRRSTGGLYVREATSAFLLGRERRRPAMTLHVPGEQPLEELFLCLISNVSPWTYLGARPVNPSPEASFDTGLDVFALGRMGVVRMLHTLRQALAREPDARGRGVHRWHDLEELTLTAVRPQGWQLDGDHLGTATGLRVRSVPDALRVVV